VSASLPVAAAELAVAVVVGAGAGR
jgi:hypothetical protein